MANCSIPSSTPATGRTLTTSSRRSKKRDSPAQVSGIRRSARMLSFRKRRQAAALQGALRARKVRRRTLDVGHSTFSSSGRVKGAWWPSRSSKPSSPSNWRDRFDSYPLRQIPRHPERSEAESKEPVAIRLQNSSGFLDSARNDETNGKGGERDVA